MKKLFLVLTLISLTLLSCGSDEDSLQKIDQLLNLYIKDSSGTDLLKPTEIGSYTGVSFTDQLAEKDNVNVSYNRKMLEDSTYYLEYLAGATRQFVEDTPDGNKIYKSEIRVSLTKKISETQNDPVVQDKLEIFYRSSPTVFEVSRVLYNNQLVFIKVPDQPNVATIVK
ncbi:hypothetical protein [Chryseobacterium balustinum]|uniref:DUF4738 domain-containing protein n=1 Tax=Chryseobacterium balustinum TaxID=246 RepID=A0AAX2IIF4_9FLAO|nr:hypothetical protein [Chryseobacterium balustinum]AZB31549.1 hypothetical protein EB354_21065 [Chryseobacterium balustinum]SKB79602.1 hypothetical protein SAMN05421800_10916 [Chryseobacterium balustinum]SQA88299.1 Uncharacterised protein [Chryseobacterium balustinum]